VTDQYNAPVLPGEGAGEAVTDEDNAPVLPGEGASDYERYLRTDELLSLQKGPAEQVHHDELLFQTVHQTSELWLKLATTEAHEASALIDSDQLGPALRLLRRSVLCLQYVTAQLDMLDQLDPWDYHHIRVALGHGSGFDSPGLRQVSRVTQQLSGAFDRAVARAGVELIELYRAPGQFERLHELAELLTDWDERISTWRFRHFSVAARAIGEDTTGIQGVPVQALAKLVSQRQLPKLWEARSRLAELFDAERDGSPG
jgi:tryptophan 2,3-dioxygenase